MIVSRVWLQDLLQFGEELRNRGANNVHANKDLTIGTTTRVCKNKTKNENAAEIEGSDSVVTALEPRLQTIE